MTITAKFPGRCSKCGGSIRQGETIEWAKGQGANHTKCPEKQAPSVPDSNVIRISGGSGYGYRGWMVGQVVKNPYHGNTHYNIPDAQREPEFLTVLSATSRYFREDGMSFGVGDERGYTYGATCRPATEAEASPLIEARRVAQLKKEAAISLDTIKKEIQAGERPEGWNVPEGDRWFDTQTIYGGGDWLVVDPGWIWYVANNGADGDSWSANNVRTGGAGAVGWRIPRTDELVARLTTIRDTLDGKIEHDSYNRQIGAMIDDQMNGRVVDY